MMIFAISAGEKTNPIQSQTKPICRLSAGNPKHEALNPKRVEWMLFEKTKPKPAVSRKHEILISKSETRRTDAK